jgi:hypothetical protein
MELNDERGSEEPKQRKSVHALKEGIAFFGVTNLPNPTLRKNETALLIA